MGNIQPIQRETILGQKAKSFVRIFFKRDKLTMIMRRDELQDTARNVISKAEAKRVLTHLEESTAKVNSQWKSRIRNNEKALEGGDPYDLADVYMGLSKMQDEGQTLRAADRKHMQTAFSILTEELATALDKPRATIEAMVQR